MIAKNKKLFISTDVIYHHKQSTKSSKKQSIGVYFWQHGTVFWAN